MDSTDVPQPGTRDLRRAGRAVRGLTTAATRRRSATDGIASGAGAGVRLVAEPPDA